MILPDCMMPDGGECCKGYIELNEAAQVIKATNERLREALQALVDNVLDYEKVNNLSPNPGRQYCWDTVANAVKVLNG